MEHTMAGYSIAIDGTAQNFCSCGAVYSTERRTARSSDRVIIAAHARHVADEHATADRRDRAQDEAAGITPQRLPFQGPTNDIIPALDRHTLEWIGGSYRCRCGEGLARDYRLARERHRVHTSAIIERLERDREDAQARSAGA